MTTHDPAARACSGPDSGPLSGPERVTGDRVPPQAAGAVAAEAPPELAAAARTLFGDRLPLAVRYARLLTGAGVVRGLIGPREAPRIWERHLLNCAALAELIPARSRVLDVGSGAGLPGLVLAIARPDLSIGLVEPLARRTAFLTEAVDELGLTSTVRVLRARAEEVAAGTGDPDLVPADIVTARAVAPLDRLARWCLPLTAEGGRLLAMKGASAAEEITEHAAEISRLGGGTATLLRCGVGVVEPPTTVVEIPRERIVSGPGSGNRSAAGRGRGGARAGRGGAGGARAGRGGAGASRRDGAASR